MQEHSPVDTFCVSSVSTSKSPVCIVNPFPFIFVLIFGCFLSSICAIFFTEKGNLLLGIFILKILTNTLETLPFLA